MKQIHFVKLFVILLIFVGVSYMPLINALGITAPQKYNIDMVDTLFADKIAIRTTSPVAELDVGGSGSFDGRLQIGNTQSNWIDDVITGFNEHMYLNDGALFVGGYTGTETSDLRLYITDNVDDKFSIWGNSCGGGNCNDLNAASLAHEFTAGGNVYHKGNVGIGTMTPGAKLDVDGDLNVVGETNLNNNKIINVALPTANTDVATKEYVDAASVGGSGMVFKRVFVTSTTYNGNLGGVAGADAKCMTRAAAAGFGGDWRAIISSISPLVNAIDHVGYNWDVLINIQGGIVAVWPRAASTSGANGMTDLWDAVFMRQILYDEYGMYIGGHVWTGTNWDGTYNGNNCNSWTVDTISIFGDTGFNTYIDTRWIARVALDCSTQNHIYCIEQ